MSKEGNRNRKLIRMMMLISGKTFYDVGEELEMCAAYVERIGRDRSDYTIEQFIKVAKMCGFHVFIEKPEIKIDISEIYEVKDYEEDVHINPKMHKLIGKKVLVNCGEVLEGELSYSNGFYYINNKKFRKDHVKNFEEVKTDETSDNDR